MTEIVEDALRGNVPSAAPIKIGKLIRRGPVRVRPAGGARVSLEEANAALQAARERED